MWRAMLSSLLLLPAVRFALYVANERQPRYQSCALCLLRCAAGLPWLCTFAHTHSPDAAAALEEMLRVYPRIIIRLTKHRPSHSRLFAPPWASYNCNTQHSSCSSRGVIISIISYELRNIYQIHNNGVELPGDTRAVVAAVQTLTL